MGMGSSPESRPLRSRGAVFEAAVDGGAVVLARGEEDERLLPEEEIPGVLGMVAERLELLGAGGARRRSQDREEEEGGAAWNNLGWLEGNGNTPWTGDRNLIYPRAEMKTPARSKLRV